MCPKGMFFEKSSCQAGRYFVALGLKQIAHLSPALVWKSKTKIVNDDMLVGLIKDLNPLIELGLVGQSLNNPQLSIGKSIPILHTLSSTYVFIANRSRMLRWEKGTVKSYMQQSYHRQEDF